MRVRILAILCALVVFAVACGVPKTGSFSPIDPNKVPDQLTETTTTTTTTTLPSTTTTIQELSTTTTAVATPTTVLAERVTMYFLVGTQIVKVEQSLSTPVSVFKVLEALKARPQVGPTTIQYRTAIPAPSEFQTSVDTLSVVTVELDPEFFNRIAAPDRVLAVAQIVLTLTGLGGVAQVRFSQNGQNIGVFLADGAVSGPDDVLVYGDYVSLLEGGTTELTTTTVVATTPEVTTTIGQ